MWILINIDIFVVHSRRMPISMQLANIPSVMAINMPLDPISILYYAFNNP
jgi:hypothetical protein